MFDLVLLVAREGFAMDMLLPAAVFGVVLIWVGNSLLGKFGYSLW
jgi:hypothetical protein